jgi:UDP-2,3-diacylglucosamine pyrophosphatase LpxH
MWSVGELVVLSDIHLATEKGTGLFQADNELADCLCWVLEKTRDGVIVLAGDVLDYLVLNNENAVTGFKDLSERTQAIIDCHPEVFRALSELAKSPRHHLVIMGGHHDSELIFPTVQETVERRFGISFTNPSIRWLVQGEALQVRVGNAVVLVEHGNVLDPWNRVDHAALQGAFSLASRNLSEVSDYQPPLGSRLVLELLNELRCSFRWIDCLKPETETVLPLIRYFASRTQKKLIFHLADDHLSMKTFAVNKKIMNSPNLEKLYKGDKEAENTPKDQAFKAWVNAVYEDEKVTFAKERKENNLIEKLRLVSAQDTFFDISKPDDSVRHLWPIFERGTDLVIHGHTHAAKAYAVGGGFYINTGTWDQLLPLPGSCQSDDVWRDFLDLLQQDEVESFRRPTFARVRQSREPDVTIAALLEWQGRPEILAERRFSDRKTGWQKEG